MTLRGKTYSTDLPTWLAIIGLVLLCVNPGITQGHDRINVLLNVALCLSPLILLLRKARVFIPRVDIPFGCVIVFAISFPLAFHPETIRWSTMLFLCSYCVYMMMLARLVRAGRIDWASFTGMIRWVVYAFAGVLVIQQICVLTGLPVFMKGVVYEIPYKLNSLTSEPSTTTLTLGVLMYFYTQALTERDRGLTLWGCIKESPAVWICYLWTISTTYNSSAFVFGPICLLPFINKRTWPWYVGAGAILGVALALIPAGRFRNLDRVRDFSVAVASLDERHIVEADTSMATRIMPTLQAARLIDFTEADAYAGHGVDADSRDMPAPLSGERNVATAGFFSMWYNYGLPCALAFWAGIAILTLIKGRPLSILTFAWALLLSGDHNVQLVWLILAFSMVYKYSICGQRRLLEIAGKHGE